MRKTENDKSAAWITITIILLVVAAVGYYVISRMGGGNRSQAAETTEHTPNPALESVGHLAENASLEQIIAAGRMWDVTSVSSFGQPVADFSVRDITGAEHKLSDYRGKHVVVVFWATWCPACNMEIPHLIILRDALGPDKLQILAISNEPADVLKPFVARKQINYVVATANSPLPPPLNGVQKIPATFFIDPNGKLKLAAIGVVSLKEDIAIINAP
jgi:thiol-disulfide isomerase/thioredoxin